MAGQRVAAGSTLPELIDRLTGEVADINMRALFRTFALLRNAA